MGILNINDDSFSGDGRVDPGWALAKAREMVELGADIIDVGGESTRPGATDVSVDVELSRVLPVVQALAGSCCVSIDTRKAEVARAALAAGASWINDVDGLADPAMVDACRDAQVVVIMHRTRAAHNVREDEVLDDDIVATVINTLRERVDNAAAAGIARARIVVDPGIGFGKTVAHNLALTRALARVRDETGAAAVLYGPSRKRFLGALTGKDNPRDRDHATLGAIAVAVCSGADIVRVHDVAAAKDALAVVDAVWRNRE